MEINNIYFFNIRTKEHEKIDVTSLFNEKIKDEIEEVYSHIGLKIEIKFIKHAESFISMYYANKGYHVIKCCPKVGRNNDFFQFSEQSQEDKDIILEYIEKNFKFYNRKEFERVEEYLNKAGLPDLLIYRKEHREMITELFFVEVKVWEDGLKGNQILWMFENNIPVKIAYLK